MPVDFIKELAPFLDIATIFALYGWWTERKRADEERVQSKDALNHVIGFLEEQNKNRTTVSNAMSLMQVSMTDLSSTVKAMMEVARCKAG